MKNNGTLLGIAVAIILAFLFRDWVKAGVRELISSSPVQARAQEQIRQEWQPTPAASPEIAGSPSATPQIEQTGEQRFDKCWDGSALTVTSRDENQTNYRCASGAIGAYTN